jgi:hypothetical protein
VPLEARWSNLRNQATRPDIATLIRRRDPRHRAGQRKPQGQAPPRLCPPRHRAGETEESHRPDRRYRL